MTTLRPYPAYRDTGVEWLGHVPEHWETYRSKHVFRTVDVRSETGSEQLLSVSESVGVTPRNSQTTTMFMAESYVGHKLCWPGDLVINSLWAWKKGLGVSEYHGIVSSAYGVYRLGHREIADPSYIHRALRSVLYDRELRIRSKGVWTSRLQLTDEAFLDMSLLLPPLPEQRAIADFLDAMDARITRFIAARKKMIRLLEEKKQAVINQAVTRGLDPDAPMKESGVDWLGDIPAHWEVRRLRSCIVDSLAGIWGDEPTADNKADHIWCVRVADFDMGELRVTDAKKTTRAVPEGARIPRVLEKGDLLLEKSGGGDNQPVGRAVMFDWDENAVTSNFVARLRPNHQVALPKFFLAIMEALQAARLTQLSIKQTTGIQNLDERHYLCNSVATPSLDEQQAIVEHLECETARIDAVIDRARREIDLMQEYRTRLISDVVTGKLDVRDADLGELPPFEAIPDDGGHPDLDNNDKVPDGVSVLPPAVRSVERRAP
jgi:type I restriction enzyme S subunit